jgi:hypothetical protein
MPSARSRAFDLSMLGSLLLVAFQVQALLSFQRPASSTLPPAPDPNLVTAALAKLPRAADNVQLRLHVTWTFSGDPPAPGAASAPAIVWVVAERPLEAGSSPIGASGSVVIGDPDGATVASGGTGTVTARSFQTDLPLGVVSPGRYTVNVRAAAGGESLFETSEFMVDPSRVSLPVPLMFRGGSGPTRPVSPAADLRFRRTERLRFELPLDPDETTVSVRLLSGVGRVLPVPVTTSTRHDQSGRRWLVAELPLASLAEGAYVAEFRPDGQGERTVYQAFRMIP